MQTDPPTSQATNPAPEPPAVAAFGPHDEPHDEPQDRAQDRPLDRPQDRPQDRGKGAGRDGRVLAVDVFADILDEQIPPGEAVLEGDPRAAVSVLGGLGEIARAGRAGEVSEAEAVSTDSGGTEIGVWEMTPGTATDVEADEVFVVLSGRATLTFDDGETLELRPGVVVRLHEGERTTWTVHERLRKIYLTPAT